MNLPRRINLLLWLFCIGILFSACQKKWDDHNEITDPILTKTLLEQINNNPDLSKFSEYLVQTEYDKVLASAKSFTVWAPTNEALQAVDPTLIDTKEELTQFVGNHIANQFFLTTNIDKAYINVKTLNGKNVTFSKTSVDGASIVSKDRYVGNGVLHSINTAIIPKVSAWEYLMSTSTLQKQFLASLDFTYIDLNRAEEIGIDPNTGEKIYKPGTGIIQSNSYLKQYFRDGDGFIRQPNDISNEDSLFTYIVLTDAAFEDERNKLEKYYAAGDSTDSITRYNVVKDLAFHGLLDSENFPQTVYSAGDSVKFHLNKNSIVETHRVSNGIVYVMNSIDYELGINGVYDPYTKIKPIVIQGENVASATNLTNLNLNDRIRIRRNPNNQQIFRDVLVQNHGRANFWIRYNAQAPVYSTKYKVYWVAANDFQTPTFQMKVTFKKETANDFMALKEVANNDYTEVYLGEYTVDKLYSGALASKALPVYLVGADVTTNFLNTLVLDYIKMVPVQ